MLSYQKHWNHNCLLACINQPTPPYLHVVPLRGRRIPKPSGFVQKWWLQITGLCLENLIHSYPLIWEIKHTLLSIYKAIFYSANPTNAPTLRVELYCISPSPWMRNCTCLDAMCKAIHGPFGQRSHVKKLQKLKVLWKAVGWTPNSKSWFLMGLESYQNCWWINNVFFRGQGSSAKKWAISVYSQLEKSIPPGAAFNGGCPNGSQNSVAPQQCSFSDWHAHTCHFRCCAKRIWNIYVITPHKFIHSPVDKTYKHIFPLNNQHILMFDL